MILMHFGIDYGSKLAGTTVITYDEDDLLQQVSSKKGENADELILASAARLKPDKIYMDAPLSLPAAYYSRGVDYHYRACDKTLRAMSPMFLGGLTARAMSLARQLKLLHSEVLETYPGAYVRSGENLLAVYQKKDKACLEPCLDILSALLPHPLQTPLTTIHQLDSLIAWYSGHRHSTGIANVVGDAEEGLIVY